MSCEVRKSCHLYSKSFLLILIELVKADTLNSRSSIGVKGDVKRESAGAMEVPDAHTVAQTFTLSELAAATNDFSQESFIGEGGFGRVYKGVLQNMGQVNFSFLLIITLYILRKSFVQWISYSPGPSNIISNY